MDFITHFNYIQNKKQIIWKQVKFNLLQSQ
jgi:hypothetical protein